MVKPNIPKTTTNTYYSFKNVSNRPINLEIVKCTGQSMNITIEPTHLILPFYEWTAAILIIFIYFLIDSQSIVLCVVQVVLVVFLLLHGISQIVYKESLLVSKSLGLYQISTKYLIGEKCLFLPFNQVQHIFINEIIIRRQIRHVLTMKTTKDKLIPLFLITEPRLPCLEYIYQHLHSLLSLPAPTGISNNIS